MLQQVVADAFPDTGIPPSQPPRHDVTEVHFAAMDTDGDGVLKVHHPSSLPKRLPDEHPHITVC